MARLGGELLWTLKQQGLEYQFETRVTDVEKRAEDLIVSVEPAKGGETGTLTADVVLIAVGRRPYTKA